MSKEKVKNKETQKSYTNNDFFLAALRYSIKKKQEQSGKQRGIKKLLSEYIKCSPTFLSMVLKEDRCMSSQRQELTAKFFGYEFLDFLALGRSVKTGSLIGSSGFDDSAPYSHARASYIINRAISEVGLNNISLINYETILSTDSIPALSVYLNKKIEDEELLEKAIEDLKAISKQFCSVFNLK